MNTSEVTEVFKKIANKISDEKLFLTELDNIIGDGDHGINLSRGFDEVLIKLASASFATPADIFKAVGMVLISKVGGAAGPLYGTAFMNMGKALSGKEEINISDFIDALKSGIDGVAMRGKSTAGEKTMLDAMYPAHSAMTNALSSGNDASAILGEGVKAAFEGVEYTKSIAATKGRASYVGERSIGHQDPGATSFAMMLECVKEAVS